MRRFKCVHCNKEYEIKPFFVGNAVRCPHCKKKIYLKWYKGLYEVIKVYDIVFSLLILVYISYKEIYYDYSHLKSFVIFIIGQLLLYILKPVYNKIVLHLYKNRTLNKRF